MRYYMPTQVIDAPQVVKNNPQLFANLGRSALVVTGKRSASLCGALADVGQVLKQQNIHWVHYDSIPENPSIDDVIQGAKAGQGCDFIIAIGGGSPMDAAKAIAVLVKNGWDKPQQTLFAKGSQRALPLIAIPTTAGTGSETTPYAILTDHQQQTKRNFSPRVFAKYALIDTRYFMTMPKAVRIHTCVDALSHLIESYINRNATVYSEYIALEGLRLWGKVKHCLSADEINAEQLQHFIHASSLAGIAIAQTGTSLPHGMGYALTYHHHIPHGKANGVLLHAYLAMCNDKDKVANILQSLGFNNLEAMGDYLQALLGRLALTEEQIERYSLAMSSNKDKLKNHPSPVHLDDIRNIFSESIQA